MGTKKIAALITAAIGLLVFSLFSTSFLETNDAGYIQIKQAAVSGELSCRLEPGMYWQNFGDIHTYKEATTFHFTADSETGSGKNQSIPTQFNDGAKAQVSGQVRVLLPSTDCDAMINVHRKFKSMDGVMNRLVLPAVRKALFASGPHMSASESYAARRNEFATLVEDQLMNGVIKTEKEPAVIVDLITQKEKTVFVLRNITCEEDNNSTCVGGFIRDIGVFREFDIALTNFVIDDIQYPSQVLTQIESQRKARMDIITQEAEARRAEARAKKAKAEAQAKIAETRALEEVQKTERIVRAEADKAEAVLQAEKKKQVAALEKDAASFEKQRQILLGEGEATRKKLVMKADGALQQKLAAWVEAQKYWADAYSKRLVPQTVFSSGGPGGDSEVQSLVKLLTAKTAQDLSLNLSVKQQ